MRMVGATLSADTGWIADYRSAPVIFIPLGTLPVRRYHSVKCRTNCTALVQGRFMATARRVNLPGRLALKAS
jgi:hypothetical protein